VSVGLTIEVNLAAKVAGLTPYNERVPVITNILLPTKESSITYPESFLCPYNLILSLWVKGDDAVPAFNDPARIQIDPQLIFRSYLSSIITSPSIVMN